MAVVSSVAALAALDPQLSLVILVGLVVPSVSFLSALDLQQAPTGDALVVSLASVAALAALDPQLAPAGVALVAPSMQARV